MSQGFGRKGTSPGAARAWESPARAALATPDDGLSPAARAFLASERERKRVEDVPARDRVLIGATLAPTRGRPAGAPARSLLVAYLLWWFASPLAAHRFYLGARRSAFAMLFLFWGGLAIGMMTSSKSGTGLGGVAMPPLGVSMILIWLAWCLLDAFLIPGVRRRAAQPAADGLSEVFR